MSISPIPTRFQFVTASTTGSPARIVLMGPTGAGKTYTALRLAGALGPNRGVIDTDRHRSLRYAPKFPFRRIGLDRFDPAELTRALMYAAGQDIDPIIVDTMTPFWNGPDGMLEAVDREKSKFEGWRKMGPVEQQMMDALLGYPGTVIVTLKSKVRYAAEEGSDGKLKVSRLGMEPVQRENFGSEFDIVLDMDGGTARVGSTCLCPELTGQTIEHPGEELAATIQAWLARDAVGQPLNPITVAAWALEDGRSRDELAATFRELEVAGQAAAVVVNPFYNGTADSPEFVSIGALLRRIGSNLRKAEQRAAVVPAQSNGLGAALTGAVAA